MSRALVCHQQQQKKRAFSAVSIPHSAASSRIGFRSVGAGLGLGDGVDGSDEAAVAAVGAADVGAGLGLLGEGLGDVMPDAEKSQTHEAHCSRKTLSPNAENECTRPPMRSSDSRMAKSTMPRLSSSFPAARPAMPAPMTST